MSLEGRVSSEASEQLAEIVRAGAGAGKTTQLISRIITFAKEFKKEQGRWPRVIATTFTVKATQEIRERLVSVACDEKDDELFSYVTSPKIQISTLDGIFSLFLRRYGRSYGLDTEFKVMIEADSQSLCKQVLLKIITSDGVKEFKNLLEAYQFNELLKMLRKYSLFFESSKAPKKCDENIYKKMICEKQQLLLSEGRDLLEQVRLSGYKKWEESCKDLDSLFRDYQKKKGFDGEEFLQESKGLRKTLKSEKDLSKELKGECKDFLKKLEEKMEEPCLQTSKINSYLFLLDQFDKLASLFVEKLKSKKLEDGVLEMSDLAIFTNKICNEKNGLAQCFSSEWDFWLIDEYQDTSPIQENILRLFIRQSPCHFVGDPQQSIYLFRGARNELFEKKQKQIKAGKGVLRSLQKNYRSKPSLLEFFNTCFERSSQFQRMEPHSEEFTPDVPVAKFIFSDKCSDENLDESSRKNEYLSIVSHIFKLRAQGAKFNEICILAHKKKFLYEAAQELSQHSIPNHMSFSSGFFIRREILDVAVLLKFLLNPYDNRNLVSLLRSPWLRVSDSEIAMVCRSKKESVWEQLIEKYASHSTVLKLQEFRGQVKEKGVMEVFTSALSELGYLDYSHFLDSNGRREANIWKFVSLIYEASKAPGFNYIDFLNDCEASTKKGYFNEEKLQESDAVPAEESDCVTLMTVHGSKGLEFKHVIVIGLDSRLKGRSQRDLLNFSEEEEIYDIAVPMGAEGKKAQSVFSEFLYEQYSIREKREFERLLYVAMTRAIESLCLTAVKASRSELKSWLSFLAIDMSYGEHRSQKFSYEVLRHNPEDFVASNLKRVVPPPLREPDCSKELEPFFKRISVSSLLEQELPSKVTNGEQATFVSSKPSSLGHLRQIKKIHRGVDIHRVLEVLKYRDKISDSYLKTLFKNDFLEAKAAIDYVASLKEPDALHLIKSGEVEWGFQMRQGESVIQGQIDLWGKLGQDVWVVDYKTGSQESSERAFKQLQYYSQALNMRFGYSDFKLAVLYPLEEVVQVRDFSCATGA